jgi:WD40 repeat protein
VALHPDGTFVATGGWFGLFIFGTDGGLLADLYPPPPGPAPPVISALSFSQDGDWLVSAGDDWKAVLWDTEDFERIHTLEGHTDEINDAAFHPTLPELATAGADGTLKFWDVETGTLRLSIPAPGTVADLDYSPDGQYLAALAEEGFVTVYMLDVEELVTEAESRLTRWWTDSECSQYLDSETCPPAPEHLSH